MHPLQTRFIAEIEMLAEANNCMLWVMDSAFEKELFISSTYTTLLKRPQAELYHDIRNLTNYLNNNADDKVFEKLKERVINPIHTVIYSLNLPHNTNQWLQDRSFHFKDAEGQGLLIAGAALLINEADLSGSKQQNISDKLDFLCIELYRLLSLPSLQKINHAFNLDSYQLNEMQKLILKYILQGLTAKEIAKKTKLSFRTVESHTDKIRDIFQVASKSELILLAIENNWITVNL